MLHNRALREGVGAEAAFLAVSSHTVGVSSSTASARVPRDMQLRRLRANQHDLRPEHGRYAVGVARPTMPLVRLSPAPRTRRARLGSF
jgi:hypothetical protein